MQTRKIIKIKEEKAKIKLIIEELSVKYKQTKEFYSRATNHEERIIIIDFLKWHKRNKAMELTKSQSKRIHILEEQVCLMKY